MKADVGSPPRRALLLFNPDSRSGEQPLDEVATRLAADGVAATLEAFKGHEDACDLIRRQKDQFDCVVVAGGDGTINAVAKGLLDAGLPLGILPVGTANDLARTLDIPTELLAAADVIAAGRTRLIDVGEVNGWPFFNVASIGLSADLAATLDTGFKRRYGRFSYALAALRVLTNARPFRAFISSGDGQARVHSYQIAVGNGRYYGAGMAVHVTATIDDGRLDLYSLEPASLWKLALMVRDFKRGLQGAWSEVRTAHGTDFEITTRLPKPVNTDGEIVTQTPARFAVRPKALAVYAPG